LRPIQAENRRVARNARIADILSRQPGLGELFGDMGEASLEEYVVDLRSGTIAGDMDAADFDPLQAAREPDTSRAVPSEQDIAGIQRQALYGLVTLVQKEDTVQALVVPIYGRGYASMLRGSIALAGDGNTIIGLIISEQGETPGIGSEITSNDWLRLWPGKKLRDEEGRWKFAVVTDDSAPRQSDSSFQVDGISGATLSSQGVDNMVRFWLGENGYGPFLKELQKRGAP
jgi:Na+-transporting NADH:ubiquinone oxidoreductase subunit C